MSDPLTAQDIREFTSYLRQCTDAQVQGVYDHERKNHRPAYAALAMAEANQRGLILENTTLDEQEDDDAP